MRLLSSTLSLALAAGALGAVVAAPAQAAGHQGDLTELRGAPASIIFSPGKSLRPMTAGLDTDGDKQTDTRAYCVEPNTPISKGVLANTQFYTDYSLDAATFIQDKGRTAWVVSHGALAVSNQELADKAGASLAGLTQEQIDEVLQDATQAAIWRYSAGLQLNPYFRYGDVSGKTYTLFTKVYAYLTRSATPIATDRLVVWNEKSGEANTQALIEVPKEPTKDDHTCPICTVVQVPVPEQTLVRGKNNDKVVLPEAEGVVWVPGTWSNGQMVIKAVSADGYTFPQGDEITITLTDSGI